MPRINEAERKTQDRVLAMFRNETGLDYGYYGDLHGQVNTNIMTDKLTAWLVSPKGGSYSTSLAEKAVDVLVRTAGNLQQGLYKANQDVYSLLKYGAKVRKNPGEPDKTVYFVN